MAALATALALLGYLAGYRLYSRYLADQVFSLDSARPTPAHTQRDDVDYVPTRPLVLFGHHYASITGLSPMLGPAVAVIWGWLPAMLWVVLGAVFVGCVHDFGALVVSMRARGTSIGKVTQGIVGPRAKTLFHLIIFFGIALAMGVFVYVIAVMFSITPQWDPERPLADPSSFPTAVLPSAALVLIALTMGWLGHRRGVALGPMTAVGFALALVAVWGGLELPTLGLDRALWPGQGSWILILLAYSFAASVLPVWSLLQARDFLNSLLLYLGLGLAYVGLFVGAPDFAAPAVRLQPEGAPAFLPFVFIIIACGAASGFHSLVSSGTTAKQIADERHARPVGYGGMIGESLLGLLAVVACTAAGSRLAGEAAATDWLHTYADWGALQGLGAQVGVFITGTARFIAGLGVLDLRGATALVAVVVVSFALTTLDSATRLLRFNITEIGETLRLGVLGNRYVASALAVGTIAFFAFYELGGQPAGLALWRLFGTTNQLLAGLALLVVSLYLFQRGRNFWVTAVPMLFMLLSTLAAMVTNLADFHRRWAEGGAALLVVGAVLLVLALWLLVEGLLCFLRCRGGEPVTGLDVPVE
ncbi:MAG TPA: carbon starvation protein A [Thermoanaerobaculia bacterium]|nr:carbon starvation protein A [Thermoanaerobaculia bacterium]